MTRCRRSKFWGKEFELAFDGFEWEALGVGDDPGVAALKPFGAVALAGKMTPAEPKYLL